MVCSEFYQFQIEVKQKCDLLHYELRKLQDAKEQLDEDFKQEMANASPSSKPYIIKRFREEKKDIDMQISNLIQQIQIAERDSSSLYEMLKAFTKINKNYVLNADLKVSKTRNVMLFIKHHIIVYSSSDSHIINTRTKSINEWPSIVNDIFSKNTTGICFYSIEPIDIIVDPNAVKLDTDYFGPRNYTTEKITDMRKNYPEYINVLWGWGSTSRFVGVGTNFCVVIGDEDDYDLSHSVHARLLAHELVHALGYEQHDDNLEDNLMYDAGDGDNLISKQIERMWLSINNNGKSLQSLSCILSN